MDINTYRNTFAILKMNEIDETNKNNNILDAVIFSNGLNYRIRYFNELQSFINHNQSRIDKEVEQNCNTYLFFKYLKKF